MSFQKEFILSSLKYPVICVWVILLPLNLFSQPQHKVDSLLNILNTAKDDTNKVKTLLNLSSRHLQMSKYKISKKYAEEALALAKQLGHNKQVASAYSLLGINTGALGDLTDGLKHQHDALSISSQIGDSSGIATAYHFIGANYKTQGKFEEALKYQLLSLSIRENIGDKPGVAICHAEIGTIYDHQSKFFEALHHHLIALQMHEESGNPEGVAMSYNNIGLIYKKQGDYVSAVKHYISSMKISESTGDKQMLGRTYANLGNVYAAQRNYKESIKYHHAFLNLTLQTGNKTGLSIAFLKIGEDHLGLQQYDLALDTLLLAKKLCEEIGNQVRLSACLRNIGKIHAHKNTMNEAVDNYLESLKIGQTTNNKMEIALTSCELGKAYIRLNRLAEARTHLMNGLTLSIELGIKGTIRNTYDILSRLESESGNHQQALVYYKLYTAFKDSLLNEETQRQIALIKEQYESEKKDKEIQLLRSENSILEHARKINTLLIKSKQDSLNIAHAEQEKIRLENEKFMALNLFNQKELELLGNEKRIQALQSEKVKADLAFQKAESDKRQEQLALLSKEKEIHELELKKQKLTKNYFIGGLGLFLVLSFFIYRNYHTRQELKMLTLRNKIASDLHDDVGSTLSSISMFSQMAQSQSKEAIPALETIGESSRKMLDAMADIVWSIKPENDDLDKVIMRMRGFAYELLGVKDIDFEFDADENNISKVNLPMEARKNLYLIFKEATNNMAKYSEANRARFALKGEKDKLMMLISDNGKGFDPAKETSGNGLVNMKKRALEIGGQLLIDSIPGSGTTIRLELPV